MRMSIAILVPLVAVALVAAGECDADEALREVVTGPQRTPEFVERDRYRHPVETLEFFGIEPTMTVAEFPSFDGWYAEILAPYLQEHGKHRTVALQISAQPTRASRQSTWVIEPYPDESELLVEPVNPPLLVASIAPAETVDLVLSFRNLHTWMCNNYAHAVFEAMYRALKPGGILGLVEHRAKPGASLQQMQDTHYVSEEYVIGLANDAGFELIDRSEINANPKDTKDHPAGVCTLPPCLRLCERIDDADEKRACEQRYRAIGESDRMTLKFRKP